MLKQVDYIIQLSGYFLLGPVLNASIKLADLPHPLL